MKDNILGLKGYHHGAQRGLELEVAGNLTPVTSLDGSRVDGSLSREVETRTVAQGFIRCLSHVVFPTEPRCLEVEWEVAIILKVPSRILRFGFVF